MKINVNYDFIAKAAIAKREFSLKRYALDTLDCASTLFLSIGCGFFVGSLIVSPILTLQPYMYMLYPALSYLLPFSAAISTIPYIKSSKADKDFIKMGIENLATKLNDEGMETNAELLMQARAYQTNYRWDFSSSIIPKLVETRHILVPVSNEENTAKLLVQEHVVGTSNYTLSYDEPAKQKVYSKAMA